MMAHGSATEKDIQNHSGKSQSRIIHFLAILIKQGSATKKQFSQKNYMMAMKVNQITALIITQ